MEAQNLAAEQTLNDLGGMKSQIDAMFEQGYIFKQEDGSLGLVNSEEQRAVVAESNSKVRPSHNNLNFVNADRLLARQNLT